jgi:hypothetical protein
MVGPLQKYPRNGVMEGPMQKYPRNGACTCIEGPLQKYPRNGVWKVNCKNISFYAPVNQQHYSLRQFRFLMSKKSRMLYTCPIWTILQEWCIENPL